MVIDADDAALEDGEVVFHRVAVVGDVGLIADVFAAAVVNVAVGGELLTDRSDRRPRRPSSGGTCG